MEQMIACGLRTVKQLKKLLSPVTEVSAKPEAKPVSSHGKLSMSIHMHMAINHLINL